LGPRSDSRPVGKIRRHSRADDGDLTMRHGGSQPQPVAPSTGAVTPVGQSPGPLPDKIGGRW
jgi:hypothetical protein